MAPPSAVRKRVHHLEERPQLRLIKPPSPEEARAKWRKKVQRDLEIHKSALDYYRTLPLKTADRARDKQMVGDVHELAAGRDALQAQLDYLENQGKVKKKGTGKIILQKRMLTKK